MQAGRNALVPRNCGTAFAAWHLARSTTRLPSSSQKPIHLDDSPNASALWGNGMVTACQRFNPVKRAWPQRGFTPFNTSTDRREATVSAAGLGEASVLEQASV
jgi:hypothetical protein